MYDIMNKAYLTGQARLAEGAKDYQAASNMQASEDTDNSYQLRRSLQTAFTGLKSRLGEYLSEDTTTSDNLIADEVDNDGTLTLAFLMPSNYNNSSVDSLGAGIHAYLVSKTLFDWFTITNKDDAATYAQLSESDLETVKMALYKRSRPERPTYS